MSRKTLATASRAAAYPAELLVARPAFRFRSGMLVDILMLLDIGLVIVSAALAKAVYIAFFLGSEQGTQPYVLAGLICGLTIHYVIRYRGLYSTAAIFAWRDRLEELVVSIGQAFLLLLAFAYILKVSAAYSRGWFLIWVALTSVLLLLVRPISAGLLRRLASAGYMARRIVIISSGGAHQELTQKLQQTQGVSVVGVIEYQEEQANEGAIIAELSSMGWCNQIDEVVIALPYVAHPHVALLIEEIGILPVDIWLCPGELSVPILGTIRVGSVSLLQVRARPIRDWGFLGKLALDYAFSIVALVLFAPIMLVAALAIKLDSRGSVLFKQRRHGFNHQIIHVYKFRTMRVKEDGANIGQVRKDDERVTRVGRFLRRTSIDELPQLLNVLRGEMSLVGPRPHAVAHNQYYREQVMHYAHRHCVKPGITGWAQVHGFRGPTPEPEKMRQRIAMDLYYIENWSIWMDLKILAITPFVVLFHRNAI